eukprot:974995-Lingulodinium_polyedra.AAC.1
MVIPQLDDLVNRSPFTEYAQFLEDKGLDSDREGAPVIVTKYQRGWRRAAEGEQKGSFVSKEAVQQL